MREIKTAVATTERSISHHHININLLMQKCLTLLECQHKCHVGEYPQLAQPPIHEIDTILGGSHLGGSSNNSHKIYIWEAKEPANVNYHIHTRPMGTMRNNPITFFPNDALGVHSHNNALVVRAVVARNGLGRMLVDDRSFVNIIYGTTYVKMGIETPLILDTNPIYGFTGNPIIPR
ncbi:Uncharacterized protein Adt_18067 [Abeliophyllum distichum]|uniref:Uncharacterized protein n=1 Tax=Abeliophyllum distichum TaxID=126358 RepID=A0ABD1TIA9_9LAMI